MCVCVCDCDCEWEVRISRPPRNPDMGQRVRGSERKWEGVIGSKYRVYFLEVLEVVKREREGGVGRLRVRIPCWFSRSPGNESAPKRGA